MLSGSAGCHLWEVTHKPVIHNPFPQLSRVAVAPFFNLSDEPTVDGRRFAMAYFAELQSTPGYEVVPLGVVEEAILTHRVDLSNAGEARRLANILGVDAVVIGSVTDYTPYYPPRCGMRVEWYAANPGFHEIPPGYGLPWGTPEEEFIPPPLVFEAEFALAKAQMAGQTPDCPKPPLDPPQRKIMSVEPNLLLNPVPSTDAEGERSQRDEQGADGAGDDDKSADADAASAEPNDSEIAGVIRTVYEEEVFEEELPASDDGGKALLPRPAERMLQGDTTGATGESGAPVNGCPDESCFSPALVSGTRPPCVPYNGPVMTHTRIYQGADADFAKALETYFYFRNDARFGGWQNYLQRSDDFIRFCCHMHIQEMLSARGGADQTRVVWRWSDCR